MRTTNVLTVALLTISVSLSAQNAPTSAATKRLPMMQPRVFVPPSNRTSVAAMQRRVVPAARPEVQLNPAPPAAVALKPAPELELVVPAAAPATAHGSGEMTIEFRDGQLSVIADAAELGKVLHEIGDKTGATVEVAPEVSSERVVAHLGPGPAADIVATLLSSPRLDFILMGAEDQSSIKRLIVRRKASFGAEAVQAPHASPSAHPLTENPPNEAEDQPNVQPQEQTPPR